jgi:TRAP-type C4-dicarboxylate transport system permease small subunit
MSGGGGPAVRLLGRLGAAAEAVSTLLFAAIFVVFIAAIAARYVFNAPLPWADELNVVLLLWLTFWTASFVTRDREQVVFDLVYARCGPQGRRGMIFAGSLALGLFFLWALPTIWDYVAFLWRERTSVLLWRLDWVYSCFALFIAATVARLLWTAAQLATRRWRAALPDEEQGP